MSISSMSRKPVITSVFRSSQPMPPAPTISTFRNERGVIQGAASVRPGATPHRQRASRLRTNSLFARRAEALPLLRAPLRVHAGAVMASDVWRAPVPSKRARGHAAARAFRGDSPTHDRAHLAPQSRLPASAPPHPAHVSRVDNKPPPSGIGRVASLREARDGHRCSNARRICLGTPCLCLRHRLHGLRRGHRR